MIQLFLKKQRGLIQALPLGIFFILVCSYIQIGAQPTFSKSFAPSTIGPGSTSTLTFVITNAGQNPVTDLAFADVLPAGVVIANPPNGTSECGQGIVSAAAGASTISFTDGTLGANSSCTISVNVTSSAIGTHMNVSGALTSSAGNSGSAQADLTVGTDRPGFTKIFSPSSIDLGEAATLTFTIDNATNNNPVTFAEFIDNLPLGLQIANPSNLQTTCGTTTLPPTLTAPSGGNQIGFFANGTFSFPIVPAGGSCSVTVDVISTGVGQLGNISGNLAAIVNNQSLECGKASAVLEVSRADLHIQKTFLNDPVPPGGTCDLQFTITNYDRDFSATNISFSDDLNAALSGLIATGLPLNVCGGTLSSSDGGMTVNFTGGVLAPGASCTFAVPVQVPAQADPGAYINTTGTVSAQVDGMMVTGNIASGTLFVSEVPLLEKEFTNDPVAPGNSVDLEFTITNSSSVNPMTEISFTDELTTFLGSPVSVTLPGSVCNGGSLSLVSCGTDCQTLSFSGGSLAAGESCSFTVTIDIPAGQPGGIFTNTTSEVTAMVNNMQVIGSPASDDLVILNAPSISKDFISDPVMPGETVQLDFHIHYSANAASDATNISFTDNLNATLNGLTLTSVDMNTCGGTVGGVLTTSLNFSGGTLSPDEDCLISTTLSVPANAAFGFHENTTDNVTAIVSGKQVTGNQASDDLLVSPVLFTKEFLDGPFLPGETATLRFSIENLSSQSLTDMIFTDNLDQVINGLVAVGLPANDICGQGSQISGSTNLIFTGGNLLSGTSCSFDVTVSIPANAGDGEYLNTTSNLSLTYNNSNLSFPPASDILEIKSDYLELTKEFIDDPINPGDQVTLEFTITNLHPTDQISSISFSDDLNAALTGLAATGLPLNNFCGQGSSLTGTSNLSFTGGSLGPGASCTFAVDLSVPASATPGTQNTNTTSTITGIVGDFLANGPFASDNLTIAIIIDNCSQDVLVVDNPLLDLTAQTATFHAIQLLQSNGTIVPGRDISYKSGGSAVLFPNFEVQLGATFTLDIEACPE